MSFTYTVTIAKGVYLIDINNTIVLVSVHRIQDVIFLLQLTIFLLLTNVSA